MIQLPQLQESLLLANDRLVERAQRRAKRFRLGLFTSVAVVGASGVAVGAGALWGPVLGHEDGNRPTPSATPAPSAQAELLSVLRRPQTNADRGPAAQAALRSADRRYGGLRTSTVRLVGSGPQASSFVLVSVERLEPRADEASAAGAAAQSDALCLYVVRGTTPEGSRCVSVAGLEQGLATASVGRAAVGVVPDGVSVVRVRLRAGGTRDVAVRDNAFTLDPSAVSPTAPFAQWIGTDGKALRGSTTLGVIGEPGAVPGWHLCGTRTVPADVPCGPAARRWRPAPGQGAPLPPAGD